MSLLGGMIAGGLSGGANAAFDMADKTIDHNRKTEVSDLEFKRTTALEQMRTQSAMARDDISHGRNLERDDLAYNRGLEQYELQRGHAVEDRDFAAQHATRLAGIRASATGSRSGDNAQLKGWESERDYLRKLAESSGLTPDQEDLLWTLESNINQVYSIPTVQTLAPSILKEIDAQVNQRFAKNPDSPQAQTYRQTLLTQHQNQGGAGFDPSGINIVDPDADSDDPQLNIDPIATIRQFNQSGGQGLLNVQPSNNWQDKNAEYEQKKGQIKSVRQAISKGYPLQPEEYEDVYHLLNAAEQQKLDSMQPKGSGIAREMFPQLRN